MIELHIDARQTGKTQKIFESFVKNIQHSCIIALNENIKKELENKYNRYTNDNVKNIFNISIFDYKKISKDIHYCYLDEGMFFDNFYYINNFKDIYIYSSYNYNIKFFKFLLESHHDIKLIINGYDWHIINSVNNLEELMIPHHIYNTFKLILDLKKNHV